MKRAVTTIAIALLWSSSAFTDVKYDDFDANRDQFTTYLSGVSRGISWTNSWASIRGHPAYCPPPDLAITNEQAIDILDRYVQKRGESARNDPIELLLLQALRDVFPCKD